MIVFILFLPSIALTHPGKTDRRGGHVCKKDCSGWDLYVGEYHLHEEDSRKDYQTGKAEGNVRPKTSPSPENTIVPGEGKPSDQAPVPVNNLSGTIVEETKADLPIPRPLSETQAVPAQKNPEPDKFSPNQFWLLLAAMGLIILLAALIAKRKTEGR